MAPQYSDDLFCGCIEPCSISIASCKYRKWNKKTEDNIRLRELTFITERFEKREKREN